MSVLKDPLRNSEGFEPTQSLSDLTQPSTSALDFLIEERTTGAGAATAFIGLLDPGDASPLIASMGDRPATPPELDSVRIAAELNQVHQLSGRTEQFARSGYDWHSPPNRLWSEIANEFVTTHALGSATASQLYRLLSLAHHDALVLSERAKEEFLRPAPCEVDPSIVIGAPREEHSAYPSAHAAVAAASRDILLEFFPSERARIEHLFFEHLATRIAAGVSFPSDLSAGAEIGHHVGREILEYASRVRHLK